MATIKKLKTFLLLLLLKFTDVIAMSMPKAIIPKTLLLVRVDAIGDYVLFRDFIEIIKKSEKYHDYKIILCGNIIWKDFAEHHDKNFIDEFIGIDRKKIIQNFFYRFKTLRHISKLGVEVAIQPTFTREFYCGDAIIKASHARERIGSIGDMSVLTQHQKDISDKYYTKLIDATNEILFEFKRNQEFISNLLQIPVEIEKPFLNTQNIQINYFSKKNDFVVICPSASSDIRKWNADNYAEIANFVVTQYNLDIVIVGHHDDEYISKKILLKAKKSRTIDLTGKTTLTELSKILSMAKLVVSNDSAAAHIAVAVNTYVLCIARGNQFGRFTQYPKEIYKNFVTIYPEEIMSKMHEKEFLIKNFRYASSLDINTVKVADVKHYITEIFRELNINSVKNY